MFFLLYVFFTYSNGYILYSQITSKKINSVLVNEKIFYEFYGNDNQKVLNTINKHREDLNIPVIFITHSTYEEVSTSLGGRFGALVLDENHLDYSAIKKVVSSIRTNAILVLDSRLDIEYANTILEMFDKKYFKLLVNEKKLSKVGILKFS